MASQSRNYTPFFGLTSEITAAPPGVYPCGEPPRTPRDSGRSKARYFLERDQNSSRVSAKGSTGCGWSAELSTVPSYCSSRALLNYYRSNQAFK
jgi:hypothetical protein